MVWCGLVWFGVVWCGLVWCGVVCGGDVVILWFELFLITLTVLVDLATDRVRYFRNPN